MADPLIKVYILLWRIQLVFVDSGFTRALIIKNCFKNNSF